MTTDEMDKKIEEFCAESVKQNNFKRVVMCLLALAGEPTYRQAVENLINKNFE